MSNLRQLRHADYTIGWICALPNLPQSSVDNNVYRLGAVHGHNIVIACLPLGVYGISSASIVATHMMNTFPEIRFSLLVGVGGGVPGISNTDIRLGDVVVSKPTGTFGGVVQYDYGKTIGNNWFQRTGALNKPPSILLAATSRLEANYMLGETQVPYYLSCLMDHYSTRSRFSYPGSSNDVLFEAGSEHVGSADGTCQDCSLEYVINRPLRPSSNPEIHYETIASGNQVMRDGRMRDRVARDLGSDILCFEMEAAGLMDNFPCLVIRGIVDYADSHKNKQWQRYASATAAAYAKELLSVIPVTHIAPSPRAHIE
ncbi:5'-methylthioadenosine/S-adenosylhomocysteine nucleosidase family protein [Aspergillus undulatus]|uniref:5'-methylthioadenosine/S-adenosylhomocysteine nucleosidase family protein n=1 Tax=Aspergillus undulatus TaxID=1810928 RepID=UPI003CCCC18E